ncbi:MAG: hypothetical protein ACOVMP_01660 [Chthoniobacterales bacterium]
MLSNVFIVAAVAVLSVALRTYRHPTVRRIGTVGVFATSFLAGWLIGGSLILGVLFASSWLLLPWLEILTRIRKLRLPMERTLEPTAPPVRSDFPNLGELSDDIEATGFEQLDDFSWSTDAQTHFYRFFYQSQSNTEAAICLVEQDGISFYYVSVTSRTTRGDVYVTWNYPFSYGLRLLPTLHLRRVEPSTEFTEMLADHRHFLDRSLVSLDEIEPQTPESICTHIETDLRRQINHNLDIGLLARAGEDKIRYSARGMLFLWIQFLRDLVRLS